MKNLLRVLLFSLTLLVILTGCGRSVEKDLVGAWKLVDVEEKSAYMEFSGERLIVRKDLDDAPETADYRLTDLQKGKFIIEVAEPGTNTYIFFLEGKFEKKDKIKITKAMDAGDKTFDLIKLKDIDKDIEKERKKKDEITAKEEKENAKTKKEEKKKADKEKTEKEKAQNDAIKNNKNQASEEQVGLAKENKSSSENVTQNNSIKAQYLHEADRLDKEIIDEAMKIYPGDQDLQSGFYGQYYTGWDDLLNEIWGKLKDAMPANEFEQLKANQIKWIQQKEQGFAKYPDEPASSRAMAMDYLTFETKDRAYYLIENYLK